MYDKWQRGVGANGDKGAYISFTPEVDSDIYKMAQIMPVDSVFQSVYSLTGEGYVVQYRMNEYHNKLEAAIYHREPRWQDQQYLQCFCDDAAMALACLLVAFYEDFYGRGDMVRRVLEKQVGSAVSQLNLSQSSPEQGEEIPF